MTTAAAHQHSTPDASVGGAAGDERALRRSPLGALGFCVVDLETTGGSPGSAGITEIGAVRLRAGRVLGRFSTLVDPGRPIPPVVRDITGIDDAMVTGAPPVGVALREFAEFAGDDVIVAHNAPFDLRFLNYERRRLERRYFTQPWVDTLLLARALLDGSVTRHDLASLAEWAQTRVRPAHRALADAEATAEVLVRLIALARERGLDSLDALDALVGPAVGRYAPALALCEDLPPLAGVFVMHDAQGTALHVGHAVNLRRDVRRLLTPSVRRPAARIALSQATASVAHEVHGSRLGARLRAAELAGECGLGAHPGSPRHFIVLEQGRAGLCARVVGSPRPEAADAFGPIANERRARRAAACLEAAFGGAAALDRRGSSPLERARAVLSGDPAALGRLSRAPKGSAARGRLDPAGAADGRRIGALAAVVQELGLIRRGRARTAILVEEGPAPGSAEAFFVAGGRVRARIVLPSEGWQDAALRVLRTMPDQRAPDGTAEVAHLIEERVAERAGHPALVPLDVRPAESQVIAALGRAIGAVLGPGESSRVDSRA